MSKWCRRPKFKHLQLVCTAFWESRCIAFFKWLFEIYKADEISNHTQCATPNKKTLTLARSARVLVELEVWQETALTSQNKYTQFEFTYGAISSSSYALFNQAFNASASS